MKLTLMLADYAEAVNGKLYIMGGGRTVPGPAPSSFAIAVLIEIPWDETNRRHVLRVDLVDGDGRPVMVSTPTGERPVEIDGGFEVGRPAGLKPGAPQTVPVAMNIGPLPLAPGRDYVWRCSVNGATEDAWRLPFSMKAATDKSRP